MIRKLLPIVLFVLLVLGGCKSSQVPEKKFTADWESMRQYECPEWFRDAKFGIYFHWGVYSVPAYKTEWYSHYMYVPDHPIHEYHEKTYGPVNEFGYKDFIPMFTAEKFNPDEWAELFKASGARWAGPVTEHADGFAMWDSKLTSFDAMDMGPKRDVVGELSKAIRKQGLKFVTTMHLQWLYAWYPTWDENSGTTDPADRDLYGPIVPPTAWGMAGDDPVPYPDEEFCKRWLSRLTEVVDKYEPDLIYFDNKLDLIDEDYRLEFLSHYYNQAMAWDREVVVTYKFQDLKPWAGVLNLERSRMSEKQDFPWLTSDSVDWGSWCNIKNPNYKSTNRLIDYLVDIVSKNGNLQLNITPTAEGEIPVPVKELLLEIGQWLQINGEAIYGTRTWKVYGEGPTQVVEGHLSEHKNADNTAEDIRFTRKGNTIYAICLDVPEKESLMIRSLNPENGIEKHLIKEISLLGSDQEISWEMTESGLSISTGEFPNLEHAVAYKIELKKV
ncbi:alpha-L-fucosidase [Bacteroidota bacterium]